MRTHLSSQGIPFEFVDAVDGQTLGTLPVDTYNDYAAFLELNRALHPNEIGCALSHADVWRRIIAHPSGVGLVLEDDILISETLHRLLAERGDWLPPDWRLVNFAHDCASPVDLAPLAVAPGFSLCQFSGIVGRSGAYLIRRETAEHLLERLFPLRRPVDDYLGRSAMVGGQVLGIHPRVAKWDDGQASDIWAEGESRETFSANSRSRWRGLWHRLRRAAELRIKKLSP